MALSPTSLLVQIGPPGAEGPPGPPASITTQHLTTANNAGVVNPATDVTFITAGNDADGAQAVTMANGTSDGQAKDITYAQALSGISCHVNVTNGDSVIIPNTGGGVRYRWDATAVAWRVVGTFGGT